MSWVWLEVMAARAERGEQQFGTGTCQRERRYGQGETRWSDGDHRDNPSRTRVVSPGVVRAASGALRAERLRLRSR